MNSKGYKTLAVLMAASLSVPSLGVQATEATTEANEVVTQSEETTESVEQQELVEAVSEEDSKTGSEVTSDLSAPTELKLTENEDKLTLSWKAVEGATGYKIQRAASLYADYEDVEQVAGDVTSKTLSYEGSKYDNYYQVIALKEEQESKTSDYVSLETQMFGEHTIFFAPTDDVKKIDEQIQAIYEKQSDRDADAQFKGEQYQIYFKPGDYTETQCMNLGFYTTFSGLGETPYDVRLNNISIPNYLDDNNATCNFWRSAENLSIINTGNEQGKARDGSWRPESFNWAVAQAAPLRRIYSERPIAYDWNYGWASGGYVADSYIDAEGDAAGTWSGQQFYTRNSKITGNTYGTTLNHFFQGVEANNIPGDAQWDELKSGEGYTNWSIPKKANDGTEEQQVVTSIDKTEKISEKPFLYRDNHGEYQVFVPAMRENTKGTSWSKDDMGEGESIPLADFYIATPSDSAKTINRQIKEGKHIYFTPGTYYAEEPIEVNHADTILLGTGMASIIPTNHDMALKVGDVDGVKIVGLIFDAGKQSDYLVVVGEEGQHNSHSDNPIVMQDLFFRIGGTTDTLTKADNALEINSDDVICDHFWIWRADHGAGVEWYGNESKHGLLVNGDNVICYALFNEHFQDYTTLWNGNNGKTYFYQYETCYDPISQGEWMSHNDTVNGYAAYKVSNDVDSHYAVGLGIYNVFINTGEKRDGKEVQIQLDNGIEVPNKEDVLIENACLQTFANEDGAMQKINHIINGVGPGVSSGVDTETGEKGDGWSRTFLTSYQDGTAIYGKQPSSSEKGKFIGLETVENVKEIGDEELAETEATMKLPKQIENIEGTEFKSSVMIGSLLTDAKMMDAVITIDKNIEVVDVIANENLMGGTLDWYMEEGEEQNTLRILYSDLTGYQSMTTTEEMPCDMLQITYRLKTIIPADAESKRLKLTLESLQQYIDADTPTQFIEKPITRMITVIEEGEAAVDATVLYTGDGSDLIPDGSKAVKVVFTGDMSATKDQIIFQSESMEQKAVLYKSNDFSNRDQNNTFIMIVPEKTSQDELDLIDYYSVGDATTVDAITFGDTNQDDVIDAQDALKTVRYWLRSETPEITDDFIIRNNVTGDEKINNADALAIVEAFIADKAWGVVRKN